MENGLYDLVWIEHVIDGDTVRISTSGHHEVIRIRHIDAPEINEFLYNESRKYIEKFWAHKPVRLTRYKNDRYGRVIGVFSDMDGNYLHLELILGGLAFHHIKYDKDEACMQAQEIAKEAKRGLWVDPTIYERWLQHELYKFKKVKKSGKEFEKDVYLLTIIHDRYIDPYFTREYLDQKNLDIQAKIENLLGNIRDIKNERST